MIRGLILLLCILPCTTGEVYSQDVLQAKNGYIHFVSDAPLELIEAESEKLQGVIDQNKNTFAFAVPMSSFEGFNSPLQQQHFNENYLETNQYPRATFTGKIIEDISTLKQDTMTVRSKGQLTIHGKTSERIIEAQIIPGNNGFEVISKFKVPLEDHSIRIPRVVHQKIAEVINVTIRAQFLPREED